jgi:hypothetical protein
MPLWGNSTSDESRPKWLRAGDKPANDLSVLLMREVGLSDTQMVMKRCFVQSVD